MKYQVKRQHFGDRLYVAGDEREANERDVAHLVKAGVLEPVKEKAKTAPKNKAEAKPENKAEKPAANKAE